MQTHLNPKVDAYLANSAPFAQPILTHLRTLIHKASPEIEEAIKWSHPFFLHKGVILANMSAFKAHCSLGFWGGEMTKILSADGILSARGDDKAGGMGSLGRIAKLSDLPPDKQLLTYLRTAVELIGTGQGDNRFTMARRAAKLPKPEIDLPAEFMAALAKHKAAAKTFAAFSPSCRREYTEWIASAKRPETRDRRIAQALAQIAEAKPLHAKYQAS